MSSHGQSWGREQKTRSCWMTTQRKTNVLESSSFTRTADGNVTGEKRPAPPQRSPHR